MFPDLNRITQKVVFLCTQRQTFSSCVLHRLSRFPLSGSAPKKRTRIICHGLKAERNRPPNECWDLGSRQSKEGSCLIGTIVIVVLWQSILCEKAMACRAQGDLLSRPKSDEANLETCPWTGWSTIACVCQPHADIQTHTTNTYTKHHVHSTWAARSGRLYI